MAQTFPYTPPNILEMLLAQQDPLGEQAGMPTMGPPALPPPVGMPGGMSGPPTSRAGGGEQPGFGEKLGGALNSPLGVLGMNLFFCISIMAV